MRKRIDAGFLNNRLSLEADYYSRTTKGILASPSVYMTMGTVSAPTTNTSNMRNQGMEFTLRWTDRIKDFEYSISANFTYNKNRIVKYKGKYKEPREVKMVTNSESYGCDHNSYKYLPVPLIAPLSIRNEKLE